MKTNVKLTHVECYKDAASEVWFMKLVYEYEETDGIHEFIIPKLELPVYSHMLPDIRTEYSQWGIFPIEEHLEGIKEDIRAYRANVPECNVNNVTWVDRIIKPAVHEMTIDEIEKKLGYKVKIVNGSNKN